MIKITHYYDHANICKTCMEAREEFNPLSFLAGNGTEIKEIYDKSCEEGKNMLIGFLFNLAKEDLGE